MKNERKNGFVLVLVIMVIALIGVVMFVLTEGAKSILFQSDTVYLQALERNLVTSGLVWAKQKLRDQSRETFNQRIELDLRCMNILGSTLSVTIGSPTDKEAEVQIDTSCTRGRRSLRHANNYKIQAI